MTFRTSSLYYDKKNEHTVVDFATTIVPLSEKDEHLLWEVGNYSIAGFEMRLERHIFKYIVNVYLPSGLFVVVSWV